MEQSSVLLFVGGSVLTALAVTWHGARQKRLPVAAAGVAIISLITWAWTTHQSRPEIEGIAATCVLGAAAILLWPRQKEAKTAR